MKNFALVSMAAGFVTMLSLNSASAGCVTGAVVGGVAGHMAGHGGVGAAAGCALGAHEADKDKGDRANEGRSSSEGLNSSNSSQPANQ